MLESILHHVREESTVDKFIVLMLTCNNALCTVISNHEELIGPRDGRKFRSYQILYTMPVTVAPIHGHDPTVLAVDGMRQINGEVWLLCLVCIEDVDLNLTQQDKHG